MELEFDFRLRALSMCFLDAQLINLVIAWTSVRIRYHFVVHLSTPFTNEERDSRLWDTMTTLTIGSLVAKSFEFVGSFYFGTGNR